MPWIRFKRFKYLSALAPHAVVCASGNRYLWKGDGDGATSVPNKADVEELLNSLDGRPCDYEVCWEKYLVLFDANGIEINRVLESDAQSGELPSKTVSVDSETAKRSPGRQKKSS